MKKVILSIVLLTACTLTLSAGSSTMILSADGSTQNDGNSVSVVGAEVTRTGAGTVSVVFQLKVGDGVTARNRSLIVRPVLIGEGGESELPPIVIRGDKAKAADETRAMNAAGVDAEGRYVTEPGADLDYFAEVPWQEWMRGSSLVFNGINAGKGDATEVNIGVVADNLLPGQTGSLYASEALLAAAARGGSTDGQSALAALATDQVQAQTSTQAQMQALIQAPVPPPITVGDELAARFTFVEPGIKYITARDASNVDAVFDYNMPLVIGSATPPEKEDDITKFVEMTRHGAVRIEFARGSHVVDRALGDNNKMLVELISSINVIESAPGLRVSQVIVVGFSAPEGADEKETLGLERAQSTLDVLTANSKVDPAVINIYNGSVDWVTLRALVAESNMPDKYKVLETIDNVPAWGSTQGKDRMTRLMELGDGAAFKHIRENFFPKLRQVGSYVKVYYEALR